MVKPKTPVKGKISSSQDELASPSTTTNSLLPFKNKRYDQSEVRRKKIKSLKQILELMNTSYGADPNYQRYNYTSIEVAPSVKPRKRYCDITGLIANYTDPQTGLRYHSASIYQYIRTQSPEAAQQYLKLRNAHTIVK